MVCCALPRLQGWTRAGSPVYSAAAVVARRIEAWCSCSNAAVAMQLWQCSCGNAAVAMQLWQCSWSSAAGAMQLWQCSWSNAAGAVQLEQCSCGSAAGVARPERWPVMQPLQGEGQQCSTLATENRYL